MKIISFFARESTIVTGLVATSSLALAGSYFPETFCLKWNARRYQKFGEDKTPVQVPERLVSMVNQVMSDLQFDEFNRKLVTPFITNSLDFFTGGSTRSQYGLMIGLPEYMIYDKPDEIEKELTILVDNTPINWKTDYGKRFMQSLLLSPQAKQYVIAKTLVLNDNYFNVVNSLLPSVLSFAAYATGSKIKTLLKLNEKPTSARLYVYTVVAIVFFLLWRFMIDGMNLLYDKSAEDAVLKLGKQYITGGIEFYEKKIERNKVLREIMKNGEKYYSVNGNEKNFVRQQAMPSVSKKAYCEGILKVEYDEEYARKLPATRGW